VIVPVSWQPKAGYGPVDEPVSLDLAKTQIRQTAVEDDDLVLAWIAAARAWVEEYTGRSLLTQTHQVSLPVWPCQLWLPRAAPLQSVTFVKYYNASNVLATLSSSVYTVPAFQEPASLLLADGQTWPTTYAREDAIQIEYVAGHATAEDVPMPLRQAMLLLIGHWDAVRANVVVGTISKEVEFGAKALCGPYYRAWREPVAA
jgi:uncharacterized phiE125 gp8 family phage protein